MLIGQITLTNQPAIGRSYIIYSESTTYESSLVYIATEPRLLKLHLITGINGYIVCVLRDFPAVDSTDLKRMTHWRCFASFSLLPDPLVLLLVILT